MRFSVRICSHSDHQRPISTYSRQSHTLSICMGLSNFKTVYFHLIRIVDSSEALITLTRHFTKLNISKRSTHGILYIRKILQCYKAAAAYELETSLYLSGFSPEIFSIVSVTKARLRDLWWIHKYARYCMNSESILSNNWLHKYNSSYRVRIARGLCVGQKTRSYIKSHMWVSSGSEVDRVFWWVRQDTGDFGAFLKMCRASFMEIVFV